MDSTADGRNTTLWAGVVGIVGIVIGGVITGSFNYLINKSDNDAKMIELAIEILRGEPTPATDQIRQWAVDTLRVRGGFTFDPGQQKALLQHPLPPPAPVPVRQTPPPSAPTPGPSPKLQ